MLIKHFIKRIKDIQNNEKYITRVEKESNNFPIPVSYIALTVSLAFFMMSVANVIHQSYFMLTLTLTGGILVLISIIVGRKTQNVKVISYSMVVVCVIFFSVFTIVGGNDGFAALWIILCPFVTLLVCNLRLAFYTNTYFLLFLIGCMWTPISTILPYQYSFNFLLRFPLLYMVSYALSFVIAARLQDFQYHMMLRQEELQYKKDFDDMTGVYNRSKYEEMLEKEFNTYKSIGIVFFDINFLKYTNDNFGHQAGDFIIKKTADLIKDSLPTNGCVFRIGGDEFVAVIKNCNANDVDEFIKKWEKEIVLTNSKLNDFQISVASGKIFAENPFDANELIKEVDSNMYINKKRIKEEFIKNNPQYLKSENKNK